MNKAEQALIDWYKNADYQMPWRGSNNPYAIWISEIMLQQTQVKIVEDYYNNWMKLFPTINHVANSNNENILKAWQGLGYYKRAHNIHETAKYIINNYNGKIPDTYDELIQLKGIGDYTASAILSIAYHKPYAAVDGNLKRIISRVYTMNSLVLKKNIKSKISKFFGSNKPGDVMQAFMDLGRTVCLPKNPLCTLCPLAKICKAYKSNQIFKYPIRNKRKNIPSYNVIVGLVENKNKFLISKRKKGGLLGGLWELPGGKKRTNESNQECLHRELKEELDIQITINKKIGFIKHQYSHFKITLIGYHCKHKSGIAKPITSDKIQWISYNEIKDFAFPQSTIKFLSILED